MMADESGWWAPLFSSLKLKDEETRKFSDSYF
jgi:hypothetical protein